MATALENFAIIYSTLVRLSNELVLISCSNKQGHYVHLSFVKQICLQNPAEFLGYYFIAYRCNFLHKYPRNFYPCLILIVTLMNRSRVLQELSLH